ncbi:helix-turn-helix domain-containing protein [Oceanobacillus neutriphilus]|uniref:HTH araC/xylS-type domain-containing protein n=1 Tax=Oceanobacillus neutriphilus TaxID=531815 RepID=A0ABQ2NRA6_9BACI|nr:helix-turn-helix domain-containing protein [Oceanobacillus neutriphilus]GGP07841.1 hypothetical protein GCM10011346_05570 [Oceanobacillus neutriphilus]
MSLEPIKLIATYFFSRSIENYDREKLDRRTVDCYEIELITESKGGMFIDDNYYSIEKGDVVFRYPGQSTQGILPYSCYTIRFQTTDPLLKELTQESIAPIFNRKTVKQIIPIVEGIFNESINKNLLSEYFIQFQLIKLTYLLLQTFHPNSKKAYSEQNIRNLYVSESISYIQTNWSTVNIDDLVIRIGVSKPYLMKLFKQETSKTILEYIDETRVHHIKKLLIFTNDTLTDIAFNSGFKSSSYFTNYFSKHTGISPKKFRSQYTNMIK